MQEQGGRFGKLVTVAAMGLLLAVIAAADTVTLANGDRITGTVVKLSDGELVIDTDYAGNIAIAVESVASVTTDDPIALRTVTGEVLKGRLVVSGGAQALDRDAVTLAQPLEEVAAIGASIEDLAVPKPKAWSGAVAAGATYRTGDVDRLDAHLSTEFLRTVEKHKLTLKASAGYGELDGRADTRTLKGSAKWQYYPWDRLYLYTTAGAEHDPARRLDLRARLGGGVGYDFIQTERRSLSGDIGLEYAREYWNRYTLRGYKDARDAARDAAIANFRTRLERFSMTGTSLSDVVDLARAGYAALHVDVEQEVTSEDHLYAQLGLFYEQKLFTRSTLSESLTVSPNLSDWGEYRVTNELAFVTPLSDKLNLRLSLLTEYESRTGPGDSDEFENTFISSLRYTF